jgi:hypothetical protein
MGEVCKLIVVHMITAAGVVEVLLDVALLKSDRPKLSILFVFNDEDHGTYQAV